MQTEVFQEKVIKRSQDIPVVVDFWAPWCGPCQFLGPVIEGLAEEANGQWELVKVNTDENRALGQQYQIMSIPAVKMFHRGEIIADFNGALPKHQIQQWLSEYLPDPRKDLLEDIKNQLQDSEKGAQAMQSLRKLVQNAPDLIEARLLLAFETVYHNPHESETLISDIKVGHKLHEQAEDIRSLVDLMSCQLGTSEKINTDIKQARALLQQRNYEAALERLINSIMLDKSYCNEVARRASIALFHRLGESSAITKKFRPRFSMALY